MTPPALGQEIYSCGFRFSPTPQEAVRYYLPRLISGEPLHEAVRHIIHHADVYACDPAELARRFRPMPRTHDRFFFTPCKKQKPVRAASSPSSWAAQTTTDIKDDEGVQFGELRKLRYKNHGVLTDWLMDEYSSCGDENKQRQFVFCKVYVSPRAAPSSDARHESAAFFALPPRPPPTPAAVIAQFAAKRTAPPPPQAAMPPCAKRPAPPPHAVMPPCAKRMRGPVVQPAPQPPAPQALIRSPLTAVRKLHFAPPQPCAPLRGSPAPWVTQTQPSPAPIHTPAPPVLTRPVVEPRRSPMPPGPVVQPPTPPAPIRSPLTAVQKSYFAPPQPCAPLRGSPAPQPEAQIRTPLTAVPKLYSGPPQPCAPLRGSPAPSVTQTQPSPAPIQTPAPPALTRPVVEPRRSPMPAPPRTPKQQVPLPTPQVVHAFGHIPRQALAPATCQPQVSVQSKQRSILDPFEAAMLRDEAEEQTVAAAPDPLPSKQFPAAAPVLQDDDDDDDDLVKYLEDAMSADEAEEQTVAAALQDEDDDDDEDNWDDLAKELELEE